MKDLYKTYEEPIMTDKEFEKYMRELLEDVDKARHVISAILDNNQISPMAGLIALKTLQRQVSEAMDEPDVKASNALVDVIWEDCLEPQMGDLKRELRGEYH